MSEKETQILIYMLYGYYLNSSWIYLIIYLPCFLLFYETISYLNMNITGLFLSHIFNYELRSNFYLFIENIFLFLMKIKKG